MVVDRDLNATLILLEKNRGLGFNLTNLDFLDFITTGHLWNQTPTRDRFTWTD